MPEEAKRARYEIALLARMNAPTRTVTIKGFANENLDSDDRRPYREHMEANGVSSASITKDTQLIDGRIQQLTYATLKGIRVTGAFETMDALVKVKPDAPDGPVIEVRDGLKDVRGGR